ncbi:MAG: hypothetical protein CBC55_03885 [Gammaproteobacteria bacterium TMED95]|nr:MAG: hypothetical protein CBC55_03885 [Gammaproteobacteria bacterium TMED95]|tara:strand:- start:1154 stop:1480 length:327 start_codon:yes stop_codon:yes gene_type:complete
MNNDIAYRLMKAAVDVGYELQVWYEEDHLYHNQPAYEGYDEDKAWQECKACDCSTLILLEKGKQAAWIFIVHGNEFYETINDYSTDNKWLDQWLSDKHDEIMKEELNG